MRAVVLGAHGQLGHSVVAKLSSLCDVIPCTREQIDLSNHHQIREVVLELRPDAIINCAAYNNVDAAEDDPRTALDVNGFAVRTLARAASDTNALLVHYSTDFVFNGLASDPYTEEEQPEPQSVYAQSKLIGEWMAALCPQHYILRVESLFGGARARSSVDLIVAAVRERRPARVFVDRWVSPSYVEDVAAATAHLIGRQSAAAGAVTAPFGLYHCVNTGFATWFDVGREIASLLDGSDADLTPVSVSDVTLRAARPRYAALSNDKLKRAGFAMPTWQDALARYLDRAGR